ncbi:MAG: lamin tail domain-containing protein [Deltaproteobacteria bacterium]|nr:lamin tail domain-containing protein [Deltaproteobacteria bacterium]
MTRTVLSTLPAALAAVLIAGCAQPDALPALPDNIDIRQAAITIAVPGDYGTIGAALAAAVPGDVVAVDAGNYAEDLTLPGGVILQGAGIDQTIIEGELTVSGGQAGIVSLNLVGPGASANTIGLLVGPGDGVEVVSARFSNWWTAIQLNTGSSPAGGIPEVRRLTLQNNGYGVVVESGDVDLNNNYFAYNIRSGAYAWDNASMQAINNTAFGNSFGGNTVDRDAAFSLGTNGNSVVRNNIVTSNLFGLQCDSCTAVMDFNNVWGNTTNYSGDASASSDDLNVDPIFMDLATGNLRLQETSPMIDAGSTDGAPPVDWDGLARPSGAGIDIGADEWSLSSVTLVINEVMANPGVESTGEYIELFNVGQDPVDLAGLKINDGDQQDTLEAYNSGSTIVPPGGYAVVVDPDYAGQYTIPGDATLVTTGNANLGNGLSTNDPIQLVESNGYVVISEWTIPFNPGDSISVERVDVTAGNVTSNWVASPCAADNSIGAVNCSAGVIAPNDPSTLIITEILANALDETTGEFVEIFNTGTEDVDANGLVIDDGDSTDALIAYNAGDTIIPAGAYAVIVDPSYVGQYIIPADAVLLTTGDATIGNGLANATDPVSLFDTDGATLIDSYTFPSDPGDGTSIEKVDYTLGDIASNWAASTCPIEHSGGRLSCNAGGVGDGIVINEIMNNPLNEQTGEFVEVKNIGPGSVDLAGLWITDGDQLDQLVAYNGSATVIAPDEYALIVDANFNSDYAIPAGIAVLTTGDNHIGNGISTTDPVHLLEFDGASTIDTWLAPFNPGNGFSVEKVNALSGDVAANWEAATTCAAGSSPGLDNCNSYTPIAAGTTDLVITEVMANPLVESTGEFVEVYNDGTTAIDLWGLIIYDGDAWDFLRTFDGGTTIVQPGEYAVILDQDYAGEYTIPAGVTTVTVDDGSIGSGLAATNDQVFLYEADGYSVIDTYGFPFNPGNGTSADRVDLTSPDAAATWQASTCAAGNSIGAASCP